MSEALGIWVDGIEGNAVPADDRGLQDGDGLFETILVRNGSPRFLDAHLARLQRGLARLAIPFAAQAELRADITRAVERAPRLAILKIIVTRGTAQTRGYAPPKTARARRIVSLWPGMPVETGLLEAGVRLNVAQLRLPEPSPLAGLKHLNRLENVMAAGEENRGDAFESMLLSTRDQLVSGVMSNVFLVKAGALHTPPVDRIGVAGVMLQIVLREAPLLGVPAQEQELGLADLFAADAMFVTNARIGVVPVRRVGEHAFRSFELALRLRGHIEALDA
jgi:4-amino-4-deoxychorismate lyase